MDGHVEAILNRGIMNGFLYGAKITSQSRNRREIQKIFLKIVIVIMSGCGLKGIVHVGLRPKPCVNPGMAWL